ncbi:peptidase [Angustibacter sp. Root456]|nr:peptidase [Angustibacter sp. Root456]
MRRVTTFTAVAALAAAGVAAAPIGASAATQAGDPSPSAAAVASALGLGSGEQLHVKNASTDANGTRHVRYNRTYDGLRVVGGDLVVHESKSGKIKGTDKALSGKLAVASTTPSVSKAAAESRGASLAKASHETSDAELVIFAAKGTPRLAYDVVTEGIKADQTPTRLHTFVDAKTGKTLASWDDIETATGTGNSIYSGTVSLSTSGSSGNYSLTDVAHGNGQTTDLNGATSGNGTLFTDSDNVWGNGSTSSRQSAAVDAHYGAAVTFDYYKNVQGRNGIFNNGTGVRSRVHYGNSYVNAFWDGTQMTYGDGSGNADPLVEIDVAGHEMSHGVTENTAGLNYSGDAGGLNEATSDIFGTAVEFYANNSSDVGDYLIGEKIDINGNGTPLRYMDKPSKDGGSKDCWSSSVGGLDPHYSSGVGNHWFYLASEGSGSKVINGVSYNSPTCNGKSVTGIGRAAAEKVWYRALSTYMVSTETYPMARNSTLKAAIDLYGASSTQCSAVAAVWDALSVPAGSVSCSGGGGGGGGGTGTNLLQNPGFESGFVNWTGTNGPVTNNTGRPARTGSWKLWLGGNGTSGTETINQSVAVPSTGTPTLSFWMRSDTSESGSTAYDRMRVQIVSGSTVTTLATYSNVGTNATYTQKTFDLSAFKGKTVTVRFTDTEDSSLQTSWVVDDTSLTS